MHFQESYTNLSGSDRVRLEIIFVSIISAALVLALLLIQRQAAVNGLGSVANIFQEFNLGRENNVAAWFSGALLALIALHALDGQTLYQSDRPRLARAWTLIAFVFLFLSLDEVGSLHERLTGVSYALGLGVWGLILVLGAFIGVILCWALAVMWLAGGAERRKVWFLIVGLGLLGSVAMQEFLESALIWDGAWAHALRITIEEGSELLGMIILLGVAAANSVALMKDKTGRFSPAFALIVKNHHVILVSIIVSAPVIALLTAGLTDHQRGRPADWLAALVFLFAGSVAIGAWLEGKGGLPTLAVIALTLLLSCASVGLSPYGLRETPFVTTSNMAIVIVAFGVLTVGISGWAGFMNPTPLQLVFFAGVCLALITLAYSPGIAMFLKILLGATIYELMARAQVERQVRQLKVLD